MKGKTKQMIHCAFCGDLTPALFLDNMCQSCHKYFTKENKKVYELPPHKVVKYAENGDPICHICGRAFRKLGAHIWNKHHITMREYCDKFGLLYRNNKATNVDYRKYMKKIQKDYCITENLLEKGKQTRLKKGDKLRYKRG